MSARWDPRVVVGVDRSLHGLAALRVAVVEAARRGVPLHAVRVQTALPSPAAFEEIDAAFAEALGGIPQTIELHRELMFPPVSAALTRLAGGDGDLLVVGDSGRGAWRGFWSGSDSRGCLRHAHCPVLAVPAPEMACAPRHRRPWHRRSGDVWQNFEEGRSSPRD
jgi:nucleotide-binding universal stress UspA family protein